MAQIHPLLTTNCIPTKDHPTIKQLFPARFAEFPDVKGAVPYGKAFIELFDDVAPDASLAAFMQKAADSVVRAQFVIRPKHSSVNYPPSFWNKRMKTLPSVLTAVVLQARSILDAVAERGSTPLWMVFPARDNWEANWSHFTIPDRDSYCWSRR